VSCREDKIEEPIKNKLKFEITICEKKVFYKGLLNVSFSKIMFSCNFGFIYNYVISVFYVNIINY